MRPYFVFSQLLMILFAFVKCNDELLPRSQLSLFDIESGSDNEFGVFESDDYWNVDDKPVLANGHVGFVPYVESMFMNGLYNGHRGNSHRARIPNYANVQLEQCKNPEKNSIEIPETCIYAMDIFNGVFRTKTQLNDGRLSVEHIQYAHRYFEQAIVNHIKLKRNRDDDNGE